MLPPGTGSEYSFSTRGILFECFRFCQEVSCIGCEIVEGIEDIEGVKVGGLEYFPIRFSHNFLPSFLLHAPSHFQHLRFFPTHLQYLHTLTPSTLLRRAPKNPSNNGRDGSINNQPSGVTH